MEEHYKAFSGTQYDLSSVPWDYQLRTKHYAAYRNLHVLLSSTIDGPNMTRLARGAVWHTVRSVERVRMGWMFSIAGTLSGAGDKQRVRINVPYLFSLPSYANT
jgi:hypothetical protein